METNEEKLHTYLKGFGEQQLGNECFKVLKNHHCTYLVNLFIQVFKNLKEANEFEFDLDFDLVRYFRSRANNLFNKKHLKLLDELELILAENRKIYSSSKNKIIPKSELLQYIEKREVDLKIKKNAAFVKFNEKRRNSKNGRKRNFRSIQQKVKTLDLDKLSNESKAEQEKIRIAHLAEVQRIKEEFAYNKANGLKMEIEDDDCIDLERYQKNLTNFEILSRITIDDIADTIEGILEKYIVVRLATINQFLFERFCKQNNVQININLLYKAFKKKIKSLLDDSEFGSEVFDQIAENLATYGEISKLITRTEMEQKEAERKVTGKIYLEEMRAKLQLKEA